MGLLVIDKPRDLTSRQVVSRVKRAMGLKKAGHTGTLDPLATGVLPVALGIATRIIPYLDESQKLYRVQGKLGETTDTYDAQGNVMTQEPWQQVSETQLKDCLEPLTGKIIQVPPIYSAIKVKGRALYRYARNQESVEIPSRQVEIESLELLDWQPPFFELLVKCSRGTYIRSLVHDLGKLLGCGAHVTQLRRLATGPFAEEQALPLADVEANPEAAWERCLTQEQCLEHLPQMALEDADQKYRVSTGGVLPDQVQALCPGVGEASRLLLTYEGLGVAVLEVQEGRWRYLRVFPEGAPCGK